MKKVSLIIGGKHFKITLQEPFAELVEKELDEIFDKGKNNDTRLLLQAFISKQIEYLELEQKINELIAKLSD